MGVELGFQRGWLEARPSADRRGACQKAARRSRVVVDGGIFEKLHWVSRQSNGDGRQRKAEEAGEGEKKEVMTGGVIGPTYQCRMREGEGAQLGRGRRVCMGTFGPFVGCL